MNFAMTEYFSPFLLPAMSNKVLSQKNIKSVQIRFRFEYRSEYGLRLEIFHPMLGRFKVGYKLLIILSLSGTPAYKIVDP